MALLAVALLLAGLPFGLRGALAQVPARSRSPCSSAIAAVAFFATLVLRLAPAAWETANRASEFLFIGLAFVLAGACVEALRRWPRTGATRPLIAAAIGLVLVGGAISGWPWDSQLARPLRVSAATGTISSPSLSPGRNGRGACRTAASPPPPPTPACCSTPGGKIGASPAARPTSKTCSTKNGLAGWMVPMLRRNDIRYIAVDRREVSSDSLRGYYFSRRDKDEELRPVSVSAKFDEVPGISRVYTNGPITVFDLGAAAMRGHGDLEAAVGSGRALRPAGAVAALRRAASAGRRRRSPCFLPGYAITAPRSSPVGRSRGATSSLFSVGLSLAVLALGALAPQLPAGRGPRLAPGRCCSSSSSSAACRGAALRRPRRSGRSALPRPCPASTAPRPPCSPAAPCWPSPPSSSPSRRSRRPTRSASPRSGSSRWQRRQRGADRRRQRRARRLLLPARGQVRRQDGEVTAQLELAPGQKQVLALERRMPPRS